MRSAKSTGSTSLTHERVNECNRDISTVTTASRSDSDIAEHPQALLLLFSGSLFHVGPAVLLLSTFCTLIYIADRLSLNVIVFSSTCNGGPLALKHSDAKVIIMTIWQERRSGLRRT